MKNFIFLFARMFSTSLKDFFPAFSALESPTQGKSREKLKFRSNLVAR